MLFRLYWPAPRRRSVRGAQQGHRPPGVSPSARATQRKARARSPDAERDARVRRMCGCVIYHSDKPSTSGDTSGWPHRQHGGPDPDRTRAIAVRVVPVAVALVPVLVLVSSRTVRAARRRVVRVRCALSRPLRRRSGLSGSFTLRGHRFGGRGRVRAGRLADRTRARGHTTGTENKKEREKEEGGAPGPTGGAPAAQ